MEVRREVCEYIRDNGMVPFYEDARSTRATSDAFRKCGNDGEWGNNVTLKAASLRYERCFVVVNTTRDEVFLVGDLPPSAADILFLNYQEELHYQAYKPR